jgi:hypothetical protein
MFIKIDYEMGFSSICNTADEVMERCGYEVGEMSFNEFLETVKGEFEIIKIEGKITYLN